MSDHNTLTLKMYKHAVIAQSTVILVQYNTDAFWEPFQFCRFYCNVASYGTLCMSTMSQAS